MVLYKRGSEIADEFDRKDSESVEMMIIENKGSKSTNDEMKSSGSGSSVTERYTKNIRASSNGTFSFTGVTYTIPADGKDRQLLEDISGYISPGSLTALMGESGAGKVSHRFLLGSKGTTK